MDKHSRKRKQLQIPSGLNRALQRREGNVSVLCEKMLGDWRDRQEPEFTIACVFFL